MGRFMNTTTKVVVSVDDSKDERFVEGWEAVNESSSEAKKPARTRRAAEADEKK